MATGAGLIVQMTSKF